MFLCYVIQCVKCSTQHGNCWQNVDAHETERAIARGVHAIPHSNIYVSNERNERERL